MAGGLQKRFLKTLLQRNRHIHLGQDERLRRAVEVYDGKNWKRIAATAFGASKTDVQCLHRWFWAFAPNSQQTTVRQAKGAPARACEGTVDHRGTMRLWTVQNIWNILLNTFCMCCLVWMTCSELLCRKTYWLQSLCQGNRTICCELSIFTASAGSDWKSGP